MALQHKYGFKDIGNDIIESTTVFRFTYSNLVFRRKSSWCSVMMLYLAIFDITTSIWQEGIVWSKASVRHIEMLPRLVMQFHQSEA